MRAQAKDFAPRFTGLPDNVVALRVQGPAMEPEFHDGWLIYVAPDSPAKHGDFVVAELEDRRTPILRQLLIDGDARFLKALNPAYPEPMLALGNGRIRGRVVYQARSY